MGSISEDLLPSIEEYMTYYTAKRVQRKLNLMRQIEYHEMKRKHENCPAEVPSRKRFLFFQLSTWRDAHQNQALRGYPLWNKMKGGQSTFGGKRQEVCYLPLLWRALYEIQEETRNLAVTLQYLLNEESSTSTWENAITRNRHHLFLSAQSKRSGKNECYNRRKPVPTFFRVTFFDVRRKPSFAFWMFRIQFGVNMQS